MPAKRKSGNKPEQRKSKIHHASDAKSATENDAAVLETEAPTANANAANNAAAGHEIAGDDADESADAPSTASDIPPQAAATMAAAASATATTSIPTGDHKVASDQKGAKSPNFLSPIPGMTLPPYRSPAFPGTATTVAAATPAVGTIGPDDIATFLAQFGSLPHASADAASTAIAMGGANGGGAQPQPTASSSSTSGTGLGGAEREDGEISDTDADNGLTAGLLSASAAGHTAPVAADGDSTVDENAATQPLAGYVSPVRDAPAASYSSATAAASIDGVAPPVDGLTLDFSVVGTASTAAPLTAADYSRMLGEISDSYLRQYALYGLRNSVAAAASAATAAAVTGLSPLPPTDDTIHSAAAGGNGFDNFDDGEFDVGEELARIAAAEVDANASNGINGNPNADAHSGAEAAGGEDGHVDVASPAIAGNGVATASADGEDDADADASADEDNAAAGYAKSAHEIGSADDEADDDVDDDADDDDVDAAAADEGEDVEQSGDEADAVTPASTVTSTGNVVGYGLLSPRSPLPPANPQPGDDDKSYSHDTRRPHVDYNRFLVAVGAANASSAAAANTTPSLAAASRPKL